MKLTVEQTYGGLTPEDYVVLKAIKETYRRLSLSRRTRARREQSAGRSDLTRVASVC